NFNVAQMKRAQVIAPVTSLQPPYSMLRREIEADILAYCGEQNIGVIPYSTMGNGLLTGAMTRERIAALPADDWRRRNPHFQEPLLTRNLKLVDLLKSIAARQGRLTGQVAIAWVLRHAAVTAAIVGARKAGQMRELVGAADLKLTSDDVQAIETLLLDKPQ
ncbi:MAG TPA: aldo/keto reductase, partial [Gemmataceae bacterium]|nr:aldo/keto reductase [Gemmataceae bacterium]